MKLRRARPSAIRAIRTFNIVFAIAVCALFLTHVTEIYSRASLVLQYVAVCIGLPLARLVAVRAVLAAVDGGYLEAQRIAVIGPAGAVGSFTSRLPRSESGIGIAGTFGLPAWALGDLDDPQRAEFRVLAAEIAGSLRRSAVDDIILTMPWTAVAATEILMEALASLPAGLALLPEQNLFGARAPTVSRVGGNVVMSLQRPPLSAVDQIMKRIFDIVAASTILVLAAPMLVMIAIMIKLDSRGPILFRQRRHGFNQAPFWITKFRTMTTLDDGEVIHQAQANDPRTTRVGRMLRRSNLDELPQLFDVLRGKMSLVGPRPHAVAHDRIYESKIPTYTRRHNVKPGLTGWAQVKGFRGQTDADWKMERRVEHDLYYIENWSILLDIQILFLTLFSREAFRNAC